MAAVNIALVRGTATGPKINGVIIPEGRNIERFILIDQDNSKFDNESLIGQWHLLSYGYTSCPDVCPALLNKLAKFKKRLQRDEKFTDLNIVFYSVDPIRDTASVLSKYVRFFNPHFIALTYDLEMGTNHIPFEKSLGIVSSIEAPIGDDNNYSVRHGIVLYLIDPNGRLKAVFKPQENRLGVQSFSVDQVYQDYIKVRRFFG